MAPECFYHIYNRGNNKQPIFFDRNNYIFFLNKIRKHLLVHLDIIAWCLMPNHFHLLAYSKVEIIPKRFSHDLRIMLSSYTRAINNQYARTGSLFQQHTKIKLLDEITGTTTSSGSTSNAAHYPFICFNYIHQNPMKANLVRRMEDWEMSSFRDYAKFRQGTICNKKIAYELLEIPESADLFLKEAYKVQIIKNCIEFI